MKKISKLVLLSVFLITLLFPKNILATGDLNDVSMFKAKVIEIIKQYTKKADDGTEFIKQRIRLKGLDGQWKDKEIIYDDTDLDLLSSNKYQVGDKVLVNYSPDVNGEDHFYIIDYVRQNSLYWLIIIFSIVVIVVGGWKGFRALIVLGLTFLVILKIIVPQILSGHDPLLVSIIGSFFILLFSIYLTEGFNKRSSISVLSIIIILIITGLLSVLYTNLARINGYVSEDVMLLIGMTKHAINLKGLFLAGVILGALGVLDDVVIAQVALVEELKKLNTGLKDFEIYKKAMKVGISHLSSMVNTLFLAYAGAALPLFILFTLRSTEIASQGGIINNEMIATEILRTLIGSIGLILAVPLSTILAIKIFKK